jgi:branched-chain amino acid transport system ATP-binding protein
LANSLAIDGVHAGYGAVRVVEDVSLTVAAGETVALLGTNGNGKSTLIKCIMGIVRPSAGRIVANIDGERHELTKLATE